ncbi:uncharacterized protein LOC133319656 [Danaus plexippus]|uniref:Uncharacterized protein n=1 Tax=Danaus plexippus plexippus TaxID=278856 RepID=A0A212F346_DANPL|nr:uncharacterized protein LOC133319656 [Danaus plexippus]OWR48168.1 hypothetical protein KGM_216118 [Danaus plexippus plexippus]
MLKLVGVCLIASLCSTGADDNMLGKGLWSLIAVENCPEEELQQEWMRLEVNKHKVNRSHDGLSVHITINNEVNDQYGTFIDICKYVDGGCKQYQVVSDNLAKLCDNYAKDNVVRALQMAKFNTDYFPLDVGEYDLKDFMIDYCSFPSDCPFGRYEAMTFLMSGGQKVACLKVIVECTKCEDDDECCDDGDQ